MKRPRTIPELVHGPQPEPPPVPPLVATLDALAWTDDDAFFDLRRAWKADERAATLLAAADAHRRATLAYVREAGDVVAKLSETIQQAERGHVDRAWKPNPTPALIAFGVMMATAERYRAEVRAYSKALAEPAS